MAASTEAQTEYWSPTEELVEQARATGLLTNSHAHADRAFTITRETLPLANATLQQKWDIVNPVKIDGRAYPRKIYDRLMRFMDMMHGQGVTAVGTFIDIDPIIEMAAIEQALLAREACGTDLDIRYGVQTLQGVMDLDARRFVEQGAPLVDFIGALPGKDAGQEAEHLDFVMELAKSQGKLLHVHVDQNNRPDEKETDLLVAKTIQHGMQNRVVAVHGISIAARPLAERQKLYEEMESVGMMVICCATAFIDHQSTEIWAPTHNSMTPVKEMTAAGIVVAAGTDNVRDVFCPVTTGKMSDEMIQMSRTQRWFDFPRIVDIFTVNGRKVLGLPPKRK
jgi:cytosine/creatinine deaminase